MAFCPDPESEFSESPPDQNSPSGFFSSTPRCLGGVTGNHVTWKFLQLLHMVHLVLGVELGGSLTAEMRIMISCAGWMP